MIGFIFSGKAISIHVKMKCFGPYCCKHLFNFHGAKSARDKTSIDVCMSISGMCKRFVIQRLSTGVKRKCPA